MLRAHRAHEAPAATPARTTTSSWTRYPRPTARPSW